MPGLSGESLGKCQTCGDELDRHGNCWDCIGKAAAGAEAALTGALQPDQKTLFDAYKAAESKRTSVIMLD